MYNTSAPLALVVRRLGCVAIDVMITSVRVVSLCNEMVAVIGRRFVVSHLI